MTRPVRVRFAPSPTGNLHIGGARTAIYNWAYARRNGGTFILRIEDTDPQRSTQENTDVIVRALKWLGLDWDEGPEVGGAFGPYFQTQRFDTYGEALEKLKHSGSVYPCFCTPEELAAKREAGMAASTFHGYDRTCRNIPAAEAEERIAAGDPHVWRLKVPLDHGPVTFEDKVYGTCTFPLDVMDDFIVMRSDDTPTYNFVVCIDDALMQITHVIRGDDHLSNTPRQILVYEALGIPIPEFAHLSMILGSDGKRLSKRHGATSVEAYRDKGYFPDALLNYLALLGWSLDGETTIIDRKTLCENFSLDRISKNPAIFDEEKLAWMNGVYLKEMGATAFTDALLPYLQEAGFTRDGAVILDEEGTVIAGTKVDAAAVTADAATNREWYESIYPLIHERAKKMDEVIPMIAFLFSGDSASYDPKSVEKCLLKKGADAVIEELIDCLADDSLVWSHDAIESAMRTLPEKLELKPKVVFQIARVAVTGSMVSPPLFESIELLGRDDTLTRLEMARELIAHWDEIEDEDGMADQAAGT